MNCPTCGKENEASAKFCNTCGSPLNLGHQKEQEDLVYQPKGEEGVFSGGQETLDFSPSSLEHVPTEVKKKAMPTKIIGLVVAVVLLASLGMYGSRAYKKSKLVKSANQAMEEGNYLDATSRFEELYKATNEEGYQKQMTEAHALAQDSENLTAAKNLMDQGSYKQAIQKLMEVRNHDNHLKQKAEDLLTTLQTTVEGKVDAYNMMKDYETSIQLLNGLLSVAPENESFLAMKTHALSAQTGMNEEKARQETEAKAAEEKARQEEAAATNRKKQVRAASNIINTFQFVTSGAANVRSGPGKGYSINYSLGRGAEVYIYDTYYDGTRTWCNIGDGWISYRTLNGEL